MKVMRLSPVGGAGAGQSLIAKSLIIYYKIITKRIFAQCCGSNRRGDYDGNDESGNKNTIGTISRGSRTSEREWIAQPGKYDILQLQRES
jgi:hypothetical protein